MSHKRIGVLLFASDAPTHTTDLYAKNDTYNRDLKKKHTEGTYQKV